MEDHCPDCGTEVEFDEVYGYYCSKCHPIDLTKRREVHLDKVFSYNWPRCHDSESMKEVRSELSTDEWNHVQKKLSDSKVKVCPDCGSSLITEYCTKCGSKATLTSEYDYLSRR